jgi:serine/threonine-protein kinase
LSLESTSPVAGLPRLGGAEAAALGSGPHAATARQALLDREEVLRLVDDLPNSDKARIPDIVPTARSLADAVMGLATALMSVERDLAGSSAAAMDKEIAMLEAQANPLDVQASEARVRRLALLKRTRRGAADLEQRRDELATKLENVALTLQNLKLDVLRLKAGSQSWQQLTTVAERAAALAREVDASVYAGDQLARLDRGPSRG